MTAGSLPSPTPARPSVLRRFAVWLHRHPGARLGLLLSAPLGWLVLAYLGSLVILFINAFWSVDPFTGSVIYQPTLDNFERLITTAVFRDITIRTLGVAAAVTVTDALIAFPIAYYMARVASPRTRGWLVVAVLIPLWSSFLVKVYAWRILLQDNGPLNALLRPLGLEAPDATAGELRLWLTYSYLWLPYMILPIFAGLERIPSSLIEASGDLGGRARRT
jgi:putative spermidine/putrescine transport system permease protein